MSTELLICFALMAMFVYAVSDTKKPVEPPSFIDERYNQTQFDNAGCSWVLIIMFFGVFLAAYGIYLIFNSFSK